MKNVCENGKFWKPVKLFLSKHATWGEGGGLPCPFLKIEKGGLILEKSP